jgi:hypothetical protein
MMCASSANWFHGMLLPVVDGVVLYGGDCIVNDLRRILDCIQACSNTNL